MRNSTFERLATDRFQAILFRATISNEAKKGEQQRHNSPQLTLSVFFSAARFFFFFFSLESRSRCTLRAFIVNNTSRVSCDAKRKVKSVTFVLSHDKRRARSRCLSFLLFSFFFLSFPSPLRHRVRHWRRIPEEMRERHYRPTLFVLNTLQKDSKTEKTALLLGFPSASKPS